MWGLRRAWDAGFWQVQLCSDASQVVARLKDRDTKFHKDEALLSLVHDLLGM